MMLSAASCSKPENIEETTVPTTIIESTTVAVTESAVANPQRFKPIADITDADSVKSLIKEWATNGGDCLNNTDITNILLIGEDYVDGSSRSDAAIIMSINRKTKSITLTSVLRDSYTYMNINGQDRFDKTNHSYSWGGPEKLVEVISADYKIIINAYAVVNFESFVQAVDEIGGVSVMVTDAEADYMNKTKGVSTFKSGQNVRLNGEQALYFVRIRKLDGEPERTERQRRLIKAYINELKSLSQEEKENAVASLFPYVTTSYTEIELLTLAAEAFSGNWLDFDIISETAPSAENRRSFRGYKTYTGNLDIWVVDYIRAARDLQLLIYGETNIMLEENHVSAIDLALKSKY
ncbi:MAG: LCP family protein [Clostridia bacterium]|nr:LCP family protein [Clostridia bacterium]